MREVIVLITFLLISGAMIGLAMQMPDALTSACPDGWVSAHTTSFGGKGCVPTPDTARKFNRLFEEKGERT